MGFSILLEDTWTGRAWIIDNWRPALSTELQCPQTTVCFKSFVLDIYFLLSAPFSYVCLDLLHYEQLRILSFLGPVSPKLHHKICGLQHDINSSLSEFKTNQNARHKCGPCISSLFVVPSCRLIGWLVELELEYFAGVLHPTGLVVQICHSG